MHTYTCKYNMLERKIQILNNYCQVTTLPVDFIMHEYPHNYFENITKTRKNVSYVTWGP